MSTLVRFFGIVIICGAVAAGVLFWKGGLDQFKGSHFPKNHGRQAHHGSDSEMGHHPASIVKDEPHRSEHQIADHEEHHAKTESHHAEAKQSGHHSNSHAEQAINEGSTNEGHFASADKQSLELCPSVEYRGHGPASTDMNVSDVQWSELKELYHGAKSKLLTWLSQYESFLDNTTYSLMQDQIQNLKILRPVAILQPDLTWRGIGVWTSGKDGFGMIRLGPGFLKLLQFEKKRAAFEMTRLVAQSWSPCELSRLGANHTPFEGYLSCLGLNTQNDCSKGSSEGSWAVSSAVAQWVSAPGCLLPAFKNATVKSCYNGLKKSKLGFLGNTKAVIACATGDASKGVSQ